MLLFILFIPLYVFMAMFMYDMFMLGRWLALRLGFGNSANVAWLQKGQKGALELRHFQDKSELGAMASMAAHR